MRPFSFTHPFTITEKDQDVCLPGAGLDWACVRMVDQTRRVIENKTVLLEFQESTVLSSQVNIIHVGSDDISTLYGTKESRTNSSTLPTEVWVSKNDWNMSHRK